ncbi:MAG TPA: shikimate dehydrogenase [Saprospiraceae bacterium]|nr:shikimate dehydrogenase [Saprospiraceae bacterium]
MNGRLFGLIGYPLSHSFSKKYFTAKFEREGLPHCSYELFPIEQIDQFPELLMQYPNLEGINVTIPYKQQVIRYLDLLSPEAAAVGAVNVIRRREEQLVGYNSDVFGFRESLRAHLHASHRLALVLGTGGASRAVTYVLRQLDIGFQLVSRQRRTDALAYADLNAEVLQQATLIINTTPVGMTPYTEACPPIPYDAVGPGHLLIDLIYNPEKTLFLQLGEAQGAMGVNGLEMLHLQAEKAWEIWNE